MSTPTIQKALLLDSKFGNFVVQDSSVPKPGTGELLVKVKSAALNPVDWMIQKYGIIFEEYPAILGVDGAGEIVEIGDDVSQWKIGDRVFFQGIFENKGGSFQQYIVASAYHAARIPERFSFDDVASIPLGLATAYIGLYNKKPYGLEFESPVLRSSQGKYSGTPLVVFGGGSSVGQYALQLANASGFSPIITTASEKHTDYLKSLGATHVIDRHISSSALSSEILKITDKPITAIYDAISTKETQQDAHTILAPGGTIALVCPPALEASDGKTFISLFAARNLPQNSALLENMYTALTQWVEEGIIKPNRIEVLPNGLAGITDGLKRLENKEISGLKLIAHP
ncbi:chaperonin 10-like protein [Crucibulum laeve]|uniref:Chaperonin 10-like protein n=1 Tax=Crucibulum laeve TaxID=68775 RepID=A0A5C3LV81_9AGAR|nr:chaperonin 10-like protein [Crucibulum laeve]